jgi:hypothetical protein
MCAPIFVGVITELSSIDSPFGVQISSAPDVVRVICCLVCHSAKLADEAGVRMRAGKQLIQDRRQGIILKPAHSTLGIIVH